MRLSNYIKLWIKTIIKIIILGTLGGLLVVGLMYLVVL
jgi:hypothetical protein